MKAEIEYSTTWAQPTAYKAGTQAKG